MVVLDYVFCVRQCNVSSFRNSMQLLIVFGILGGSCQGPINLTAVVLKMTACRRVQ